jgi:prevent-host-death family protein
MAMKVVSIQDLKAQLSGLVAEAEAGGTVVITRHGAPVAQLGPAVVAHVHRGRHVGTGRLKPILSRTTKGRYLKALGDDRNGR